MKLLQQNAEVFVPDSKPLAEALARTTHLAISAHQDDIEIMAPEPILKCFQHPDLWFSGVVMTDGRGSPRDDIYKNYSDEEMRIVRLKEQKKAAVIGEYAVQVLLDYPSKAIKDSSVEGPVIDLVELLTWMKPKFVYTHNLADKHDTHIATVLRVINAIHALPPTERPEKLYGCEVWRSLDWLLDNDKVPFDVSRHTNLQDALLGVFDSQICGGKRYDLASMGRRKANATYFESHGLDSSQGLCFGMDLTPLILDNRLSISGYIQGLLDHFTQDVNDRLARLS
jgi:LmbE family N-acetylglucosaminyl deacetylase